MKKIFLILSLSLVVFAQQLEVENFEANLYSKAGKNTSKKINLSMALEGRDVEDGSYKVIDALNIVIGSFYAEDLLTSKGKLAFKKAFSNYASKTYSIEIDHIYIKSLFIIDKPRVDEIVEALKREGCCGASRVSSFNQKEKKQELKPKELEDNDDIIVIE